MSRYFAFPILLSALLSSCEGPQGPPGSGLGSLSDPSVQPVVIYTYPPQNSSGPYPDLYVYSCGWEWCGYYSQFQVRFNKFMDISTMRKAVRLYSALGDIHTDTSFILSIGGDVFILNPVDSNGNRYQFRFKVGQSYTMAVDSTAKDINSNFLKPPFSMNFLPEPHFRVSSTWPANGATDVGIQSSIGLQFNSPVDTTIFSHLTVTPPLPLGWIMGWDSTSITYYYYGPGAWLSTATSYSIDLDGSAQDREGNQLTAPFTLAFRTSDFKVNYTYPPDGAGNVAPGIQINVGFTTPFDTSGIQAAFHIAPPTMGTIGGTYYGSSSLIFYPAIGLLPSTTYTVRIDSTVKSIDGVRLADSFEWTFSTAPFLITSTGPSDGAIDVYRGSSIYVSSNSPLLESTIAGAVRLSPMYPISFNTYTGSWSFSCTPVGQFEAQTTYTVTIDTTLRTLTGARLEAPYAFSFKTGW